MFHRYSKKKGIVGKAKKAKPLKDLTRIIPAAQLLAEERRNELLSQIRAACALEDARFESLCTSLLHNLTNYYQSLPETSVNYYSQQGGLIDHALNRTEAALNLFRKFIIEESQAGLSEEQKLWQYALFSAAILQGIGKLQIDYAIALYDNKGHFLKYWNPLLENLITLGSHYSYEFEKEADDDFRRRLNLLLARQLMPASGFAWIASDNAVLAIWLCLLNEDLYSAGTLGAILIHADAIAIQRYLQELAAKTHATRSSMFGRVSAFSGGSAESVIEIEQQIGLEFIQWLTNSLAQGKIHLNKAPLFMVPGGMLMCADMFKLFIRQNPEFKNWQAVQNGFLALGLHKSGADGTAISRFEQASTQEMQTGIVFADYAMVLPAEVTIENLQTGALSTMSATELIYQNQFNQNFISQGTQQAVSKLTHLAASGEWQTPSTTPATGVQPNRGRNG